MKDQFLLDESLVFLNHGSFGACPREVFDVYHAWQLEMERNPVEFLGRRSAALLLESRHALAVFLGVEARDLVYIQNATTGVNIVAASLDLGPGDEIVTTDQEYGACDNAWEFQASLRGATVVRATIPLPFLADDFVERIWAKVTPATRLISVSHITSTTAVIFPVAKLCERARAAGILILVDGAHAPGQIALDVAAIEADYYVGNCHKWMCAPKGAGFLYARPEHQARLNAPVISWGYSNAVAPAELRALIGDTPFEKHMQWQGTRDIAAFLTVPAAIRFLDERNWEQVQTHCHGLALGLHDRMLSRTGFDPVFGPDDFAQMVALAVPATNPGELQRRLFEEFRIEVPVTAHAGQLFVRVSVQGYNTSEDIAALEDALAVIFRLGC
jgi:isopenicillin-N epimerase